MLAVSTITSRGRFTIPKRIIGATGLRPGDKVQFEIVNVKNRELSIKKYTGK